MLRRLCLRAGALALVLAALGAPATARTETPVAAGIREGVLHLGNGAEPRSLDPHLNVAFTDSLIIQALFEGLVYQDGRTGEITPGGAERWEVSPDGRTYTFFLRRDARWSDGAPVTARDFLWSFQRNLSPALGTEYSYMLWPVRGAEAFTRGDLKDFAQVGFAAVDEFTLRIELEQPVPYFLSLIVHDSWRPVPRHVVEKFGAIDARPNPWDRPGNHVSNGPWRLAEWRPNEFVRVVRNPHYWDAARVGLNEIRFYPIENTETEQASYLAGQLHQTYKLSPDRVAGFRRDRPHELRIEPWLETWFIRTNLERPPLGDTRVRRALSLAIDREAIVEFVTKAGQQPAYHFTPPGAGGYQPPVVLRYDPAEARRLLAEAGFPGGRGFPRLRLQFNTDEENRRILQAIQEMWAKELGLRIELINMDFKVYIENQTKANFDLSRSRWIADYDDPNTFLGMFVTGGGNNNTNWSSPHYDALLARAAATSDVAARHALFTEAETLLLEQLPILPVFFGNRVFLRHPSVQGYALTHTGYINYKSVRLVRP